MSGILAAAFTLALQAPITVPPPAATPSCSSEGHGQFDFWVGEWDVFPNGAKQLIAHSRIEKLYGGCAVRENWMPLNGGGGGSLNSYEPTSKTWHQTWIGAQPGRVEFDGGYTEGKIVLTGFWAGVNGPGKDALIRMSYIPQTDGSVRQLGEQSTDHGLTWGPNFDFIYKKRTTPIPVK